MSEPEKKLSDVLSFCPGCFASSEDGSWGCVVYGDNCTNCGSNGTIQIPRWAVDCIRKSASWVGKRYYPSDEDIADRRELRYLRSIAPPAPMVIDTVAADPLRGVPEKYSAKRGDTSIFSYPTPEIAAIEGNKTLRYPVPDDFEPTVKKVI